MPRLVLGLDSSTQSLSAVVLDLDARRVALELSLRFDEALPHYGARDGVLRADDPTVVHAPPLMWVEALDLLLARLREAGVNLGDVLAISGCGQQHGSVYLNEHAGAALAGLNADAPLADQLRPIFSRATSPIWMDSSTTAECAEIRDALGGVAATARATGSDAFERFTGPQIRRFWKSDPAAYEATRHIALVSSFMASVLAGRIAPIDHGDGAGMNLMDIAARTWHPGALAATAPGLAARLPALAPTTSAVGPISPYFVRRHGFRPATRIVAWSGDNPSSALGLGLTQPGAWAISLGTSFTCFGIMKACRVDTAGEGHVFGAPTGDYLSLICFKNGALARNRLREQYHLDWKAFDALLESTPPGNRGRLMLPWFDPEIVPRVLRPGAHRLGLPEGDVAGNIRALVEAQMLGIRLHSAWMGEPPSRIYATGGASGSIPLLRVMAEVMGCPVERCEVGKSAALGGALQAAHPLLAQAEDRAEWEHLVEALTAPVPGSRITPRPEAVAVYASLLDAYAAFEREALGNATAAAG